MADNMTDMSQNLKNMDQKSHNFPCKIIVLGNEKGGSGKSTTAMHIAIALIRMGNRVGTIDLDARQGTLTRYFSNRFSYIARSQQDLPSPDHMAITKSLRHDHDEKQFEESGFLDMALHELSQICDYIVIDTPGHDTYLNRLAHNYADVLITPMNDSLIDLDVLAQINPETFEIERPSFYTEMIMDIRSRRMREHKPPLNWIVMRNRLSHLDMTNKRQIGDLLDKLSAEFGFQLTPGFGERVIFRELFLQGLTLMDIQADAQTKMTMSEIAARQEVRALINHIIPPQTQSRLCADAQSTAL